jgi:hypothetical protein
MVGKYVTLALNPAFRESPPLYSCFVRMYDEELEETVGSADAIDEKQVPIFSRALVNSYIRLIHPTAMIIGTTCIMKMKFVYSILNEI